MAFVTADKTMTYSRITGMPQRREMRSKMPLEINKTGEYWLKLEWNSVKKVKSRLQKWLNLTNFENFREHEINLVNSFRDFSNF